MSRPAESLIGSVIADRYEVLRVIGKGGMGTIYEVRNTRLGRSFALKTLSGGTQEPEVLARFRREAEIVARLTHPNILDVVDWDQLADGSPCMVMEYLRGEDLAARLRASGQLPWSELARIADQVLSALTAAHRAGVVHRDLKPQNIFLAADDNGDECVKLLDFGISKLHDARTFTTTDAKVMGTPAYMPPEQAEGRQNDIGPATDVWAMGTILYEMATAQVAFEGTSIPSILYRVCHGRPHPIRELRPDVPNALVKLIDRALTPSLADRIATIDTLRSELRSALEGLPGVSWSEPLRSRTAPAAFARAVPTPPSGVPVQDRNTVATGPVAVAETMAQGVGTAPTIAAGAVAAAPERRPWMMPALLASVVAISVVLYVAMRGTQAESKANAPTTVVSTAPGPAPIAAPAPSSSSPAPTKVTVGIDSVPPGAEVFRLPSETKVGVTPWATDLDRSDGMAVFVVKKAGFTDSRVELDLRSGSNKHVDLVKLAGSRPTRPTTTVDVPPSQLPTPPQTGRRKGEPVDPFGKKP